MFNSNNSFFGSFCKKIHDIGLSGWYILVGLIPIIGEIWLIAHYAMKGQQGANQYGADPKDDKWENPFEFLS